MDISIITVGMNHKKYIENLYRSLLVENRPKVEFECIYVDNCSTDGSQEWLKDNYPEVKIIQNKQPLGFGNNNNIGTKEAKGKYIAIINPDIEFIDNAIDNIVVWMEQHSGEYGIVGPKLLNPNRTVQYSVRRFMTPKTFFFRFITKGNDSTNASKVGDYLCRDIDMDKTQPVNWIIGAAMFCTREFYEQLGGFDEDYFLYVEDEDMCLRSWKLGKPVFFVSDIVVVHNHLRASSKVGKKMLMHFKSFMIFFRKHGGHIKDYVPNTIS